MRQKSPTFATLLLVFALLTMTACGLLSGGLNNSCDQDMIDALRIPLPSSASNLTESCAEGFAPGNGQYRATFNLAPADFPALQANTLIQNWETTVPANASVYKNEAAGLTSFQYGAFGDGAIMEEVLVDTSNPQQYKIYFYRAFVD